MAFKAGTDKDFSKALRYLEEIANGRDIDKEDVNNFLNEFREQKVESISMDKYLKKENYDAGPFLLNIKERLFETKSGTVTKLTEKEANLLFYLLCNKDEICAYWNITNTVWGQDSLDIRRSLNVFIIKIRKLIAPYGGLVTAVRGYGYKLTFTNKG